MGAETLDASRIVGIVIGFGGGVDHAVGVGHRFRGLIHGFGIADVVFAVGIVGLVVVFRVAADAWAHVGAVACGHATARIAVGRIVGVVFRHLLVRRASGEGHQGNERKDSERFHFIVFLFVLEIIFRCKNMQNSYQNRYLRGVFSALFQFYDLPFAVAICCEPRVAFIVHISNAIDVSGEYGSGPNIDVVGRFGRYAGDVGIQMFGVDEAIASQVMFGIANFASEGHFCRAIAEVVFQDVAVHGEVDVPATFFDVEENTSRPNGVDAIIRGVDVLLADAFDGVGADEVADGGIVDGLEAVKIHGQVDAVVETAEPVEVVLVLDEKCVANDFCRHFPDEVFRASQFQMLVVVLHQLDIHVVEHRNGIEPLVKVALFGDGFSVVEERVHFAARGHQTNEEKQDCDAISFHGVVSSICVGYGSRCRC